MKYTQKVHWWCIAGLWLATGAAYLFTTSRAAGAFLGISMALTALTALESEPR